MPVDQSVPEFVDLAMRYPLEVRVIVGIVGGLLIVGGARAYRWGLGRISFAVGALGGLGALLLGVELTGQTIPPFVLLFTAMVGGILVLMVAMMVHRLALVVIGFFAGATGAVAVASLFVDATPLWAPIVGALSGALVFPLLFPLLLKLFTSVAGAVVVAWALGRPDNLLLIIGLWVFGVIFQALTNRRKRKKKEDDG